MSTGFGFETKDFVASASDYAYEAIQDYERSRWNLLPLHAGAATEFLAKAALAKVNPLLLADSGGQLGHSLVQLSGVDGRRTQEIRTVGLREAIHRLRLVKPSLQVKEEQSALLAEARNLAAHIGAASDGGGRTFLAFLCVANAILPHCGISGPSFWREYDKAVNQVATLRFGQEDFDALSRIALATAHASKADHSRIRVARSEVAVRQVLGDHQEAGDCPICECQAIFDGRYEKNCDVWIFIPESLDCHGCRVKLRAADVEAVPSQTIRGALRPRPPLRSASELASPPELWRQRTS